MFGITQEMLTTFFIRLMVLFTAMPVHECAHGFVADRLGDGTPRSQGRLTLNPFAHLDWTGSLLLFMTGFGWARPVIVDTRNFKHPRRDMALTSLAGPTSNILLALLGMAAFKGWLILLPAMRTNPSAQAFAEILYSMVVLNVRLAVLNLLPAPPLDGSKIIGAVLPESLYKLMLRYQQQISMALMLLLIFHALDKPIIFLSTRLLSFLDKITLPSGILGVLFG